MTEPGRDDAAAGTQSLQCEDLDAAIALFTGLGMRLDTIFPADAPAIALLGGRGARVRLVRTGSGDLAGLVARAELPATRPSYVVVDGAAEAAWKQGRAGMQYRDLIPDRQGGRYIASLIRIPDGGPVADYVHHHAIQFQLIYVYQGWVRVVFEDQGEPFVMHAGECVLQPPGIRHRVLEASPGLEVIELGAPAVHATHVDHDRDLPNLPAELGAAGRAWTGQRFVWHRPSAAQFEPAAIAGFESCELGIHAATGGLASARVLRVRDPDSAARGPAYRHEADLLFHFVLRGQLTLDTSHRLGPAAAFVVPAGQPFVWREATPELELLQISLPGEPGLARI
ncbi:MAG TPA: cupin domain-containing protein [Kofleriaceae bacterium]